MVTQCPVCRQWFHIAREQVEAAHGLARCGECDTAFNALATLRESPPPVQAQEIDEAV
ncbi:MAG: MJ0042-type zinc finger domain-containing protein, partial [Gammaproteobacteria bacterium]